MINPHQPGCTYPFPLLSGAGVAFKLARKRSRKTTAGLARVERFLEVVALGTIADAVALVGKSRVIARLGLERLSRTGQRRALSADRGGGTRGRAIHADRWRSSSRRASTRPGAWAALNQALQLLMARDRDEARAFAVSLDEDNTRRRALDEAVEREAAERVERDLGWPECASIVLWSEHWHPGVLGSWRRGWSSALPAAHGARGDRRCLGRAAQGAAWRASTSPASSPNATDLLEAYGGHAYAAGLTAARERLRSSSSASRPWCGFHARSRTLRAPRHPSTRTCPLASCDLRADRLARSSAAPRPGESGAVFRAEPARESRHVDPGRRGHLKLWRAALTDLWRWPKRSPLAPA